MGFILDPYRFAAAGDSLPVSGAIVWLDASDTATITGTNPVTNWADKSGNGWDHAPTDTGPVSGTRTVNGLNGLDFQGGQELQSTIGPPSPPVTNASDGSFTIYVVATTDSISGTRNAFDQDGQSNRIGQHVRLSNSTSQTIAFSSASTPRTDNGPSVSTATPYIFRVVCGGTTNVEMFVNAVGNGATSMGGAGSPSSTYSSATTVGRISSGLTQFWDGIICEIIAYDWDHDSTEISDTESHLADKWGITL